MEVGGDEGEEGEGRRGVWVWVGREGVGHLYLALGLDRSRRRLYRLRMALLHYYHQ
jgi:hypothetical protein